jgi:glycosyltransferase involved in cell wall biosynthesis
VRHELTGYLVPHGDTNALAERMLQLAADPSLVERLGGEARRFAEAHSWERTADETEAHLRAVIEVRGKR